MLDLKNIEKQTKEFAKKFVAPYTYSVDNDARFPIEAYSELKKQGYMGLLVPKEYGGKDGKSIHHMQVCYTLAQFDASSALCYMMHNVATMAIVRFGTNEQKEEFLPKIAKGEITFALAYSESGSGTHFGLPDIKEIREDKYCILNGRKSFVTSATQADYYITYTNSACIKGAKNNWITPSNDKNLFHEDGIWNGLGMRGNISKPVQYNNVKLETKRYLLGNDGDGEKQAELVAMYFIIGLGAVYSGIGESTYQCILKHCKERKYSDNSTLLDKEMVRVHLANLYTKTQSQIALVKEATHAFDNNQHDAADKIFASRINATELVMDICNLAMRLGGGKAYSKILPLERYLRDALASQVMAPSLDILYIWLADSIINKEK